MTTPTTQEVTTNIINSISAKISQTVPLIPRSFIAVMAKAQAAVFIILYKRADFVGLQWFVRTASIKETTFLGEAVIPLVEMGRQIGVGDPTEATQAELLIDITVEVQVGSLPSGTQIIGPQGITYILIGSVPLNAPTVQGTFRAVADQSGGDGSGVQGNLADATQLNFANPLANVSRTVVVNSAVVTAANAEDLDVAYRSRVLDRFQKRPQGGALADYEQWGEEVEGIINVYPYTGDPGQVDVFSEATEASSGSPDGIPTGAQLTAVLDSINFDENGLASRRPANAFVNSLPITRESFDIEVEGITNVADIAQVEADITAAMQDIMTRAAPFILGLTIPPRLDNISRSALIGEVEDIVSAANGLFTTVRFEITGSGLPIELYTLGRGEKAKANVVTFI